MSAARQLTQTLFLTTVGGVAAFNVGHVLTHGPVGGLFLGSYTLPVTGTFVLAHRATLMALGKSAVPNAVLSLTSGLAAMAVLYMGGFYHRSDQLLLTNHAFASLATAFLVYWLLVDLATSLWSHAVRRHRRSAAEQRERPLG